MVVYMYGYGQMAIIAVVCVFVGTKPLHDG